MSTSTAVVKIDKERHSEIKMYAAFKGVKIVDIINQAVDYYLSNLEEFNQFKKTHLLIERTKNIIVSEKDFDELVSIARENNIKLNV